MFDIGWSEMAIIAFVALIAIGPKDLPRAMKTVAHWMRKARSLSREFQSGIDEMVREAELEDARKALESTRHGNLQRTIGNAIDPEGELTSEVKSVEREASREPGVSEAAPSVEAGKDGNAGRAAATMTTQPLNIAPAHSLKPAEAPAAAGEGQQGKPAGQDSNQGSKQSA